MIASLIYTSARQGLFPGNTGFSVVGCTRNIDPVIRKQLEDMSGYTPLYPHYSPEAWNNPINFSHRIVNAGGRSLHILSRICYNGVDYTQRSNKLASHIALTEDECLHLPSGPASVFQNKELFKDASWVIETGFLDDINSIPDQGCELSPCYTWKELTGDAGWAGAIVEDYLLNPNKNFYFVFDPSASKHNLALVNEALQLLPAEQRWRVSFSTFYTENIANGQCQWRFCPQNSDILAQARRNLIKNAIFDLTQLHAEPSGGELVSIARTGERQTKIPSLCSNATSPVIQRPMMDQVVQSTANIPDNNITYAPKNGYKLVFIAYIILSVLVAAIVKVNHSRHINDLSQKVDTLQTMATAAVEFQYHTLLEKCNQSKQYQIPEIEKNEKLRNKLIVFLNPGDKTTSLTENNELKKEAPEGDKREGTSLEKKNELEKKNIGSDKDKKAPVEENDKLKKEALELDKEILDHLSKLNEQKEYIVSIQQKNEENKNLLKQITEYNNNTEILANIISAGSIQKITIQQEIINDDVLCKKLQQCTEQIGEWEEYQNNLHQSIHFPKPVSDDKSSDVNSNEKKELPSCKTAWRAEEELVRALKEGKVFSASYANIFPEKGDCETKIKVYADNKNIEDDNGAYRIVPAHPDFYINVSIKKVSNKENIIEIKPNKCAPNDLTDIKLSINIAFESTNNEQSATSNNIFDFFISEDSLLDINVEWKYKVMAESSKCLVILPCSSSICEKIDSLFQVFLDWGNSDGRNLMNKSELGWQIEVKDPEIDKLLSDPTSLNDSKKKIENELQKKLKLSRIILSPRMPKSYLNETIIPFMSISQEGL